MCPQAVEICAPAEGGRSQAVVSVFKCIEKDPNDVRPVRRGVEIARQHKEESGSELQFHLLSLSARPYNPAAPRVCRGVEIARQLKEESGPKLKDFRAHLEKGTPQSISDLKADVRPAARHSGFLSCF